MQDLPPGVTPYKDRHGKTRHRFRRKGLPPCEIPGQPGEQRFIDAAQKAAAGLLRQPKRKNAPGARTLRAAWLEVTCGVGRGEWQQLRASSRDQQIGVAERFLAMPIAPDTSNKTTFGQMPFAGIRRGDVKKILARFADRPHAGEAVLRLLRKLSLVALDLEWIESDPTFRIKYRPKLIGHRAWTDAEMAQYEQKWPLGTRERLAYALTLYTGQRRADVAAMAAAAYSDGAIAVTQEKTGAPLLIPAHPELVAAIEATPQPGAWLLCASHGGRFTKESFGNFMSDSIGAAEMPDDCRLHGLRKSAGRCLAEAGCTAHQIMAILGHKTLAEAQHYTEDADQRRLARQGIEQWARPKLAVMSGGK